MQKLKLPFSLFLVVSLTPRTSQFPEVPLNQACSVCTRKCPKSQFRQLSVDTSHTCLHCACLDDLRPFQAFQTSHPVNVPFPFSYPALTPVGETAEFSCVLWCQDSVCQSSGGVIVTMDVEMEVAPTAETLRLYVAETSEFWVTMANWTLTVKSATDSMLCRVKGHSISLSPFPLAFDMADPVLVGPEEVDTSQEYQWQCRVNFVSFWTNSSSNRVDFSIELMVGNNSNNNNSNNSSSNNNNNNNSSQLNTSTLGPFIQCVIRDGDTGMQVSKMVKILIPESLRGQRFNLTCQVLHEERGASKTSQPLTVSVPNSDRDQLSSPRPWLWLLVMMITMAISISIFIAFVLNNKMKQHRQQVEPSPALSSAELKREFLKDTLSLRRTYYSVSMEEEPESSLAVLDLPHDLPDVKYTPNTLTPKTLTPTSASPPPLSTTTPPSPPLSTPTPAPCPPGPPVVSFPPAPHQRPL